MLPVCKKVMTDNCIIMDYYGIMLKATVLVKPPELSSDGPTQYLHEGPPNNKKYCKQLRVAIELTYWSQKGYSLGNTCLQGLSLSERRRDQAFFVTAAHESRFVCGPA